MKNIITALLFCLPIFIHAQTDTKYLEGAITLKDGKVTFSTEMIVPAMTKEQIYESGGLVLPLFPKETRILCRYSCVRNKVRGGS